MEINKTSTTLKYSKRANNLCVCVSSVCVFKHVASESQIIYYSFIISYFKQKKGSWTLEMTLHSHRLRIDSFVESTHRLTHSFSSPDSQTTNKLPDRSVYKPKLKDLPQQSNTPGGGFESRWAPSVLFRVTYKCRRIHYRASRGMQELLMHVAKLYKLPFVILSRLYE